MYAIYGNMDPINIPQMLAYIPAPWIRHGIYEGFLSHRNVGLPEVYFSDGWLSHHHCEAPLKLLEGNAIGVPELQSCCVFVRHPEDLGCCLWYIANKYEDTGEQWISCTYINKSFMYI